MSKQIRLNVFDVNAAMHNAHGLWKHPENQRHRYKTLDYWVELAEMLEAAKVDALFLADVLGYYDTFQGSRDAALRDAIQVPINDPSLIIPTMAYKTRHLAFALTVPTTYESPYAHARRMTTLDHLTNGRVGWNVVTSFLPSAARNFGLEKMIAHDERYDMADEYMDVVYKLWEASWDDDAVVRDIDKGVYTDPARVHEINHRGKYFNVPGPHLSEPSLQRTPVLFQAGGSARGRAFAAKHAECVFIDGHSFESMKFYVDDIRAQAVASGRRADDVKVFMALSTIVGRTEAEAEEQFQALTRLSSAEGPQAIYGGYTGVDLSKGRRDEVLGYRATDHGQTVMARFTTMAKQPYTYGEVIDQVKKIGGRALVLKGSGEQVASQMQEWMERTGIDGFNLGHLVTPSSLKDFFQLVIPVLQERGAYKTEYAPGTLREKLFGEGQARLPAQHPGAAFRS